MSGPGRRRLPVLAAAALALLAWAWALSGPAHAGSRSAHAVKPERAGGVVGGVVGGKNQSLPKDGESDDGDDCDDCEDEDSDDESDEDDEDDDSVEPAGPVDPHAVGDEVTRILADPAYRFCSDDRFPPSVEELHQWCPLAKDAAARCPKLQAACARAKPEDGKEWKLFSGGGFLGSLAVVTFWGIIVLLVAGLVFFAVRFFAGGSFFLAEAAAPVPTAAPAREVMVFASHEPERDVARLLAAAQVAATAGDHARAIDLVYAALLRHLEGAGLVRVRRDRTNGDYVRALRKHPEVQSVLRAMVNAVERVQFGGEPPSADRYATLLQRVTEVVSRPLAVLLLVLGLFGAGCGQRGRADDTPGGASAVRRLLQAHDRRLSHRIAPVERLDHKTRALVVRSHLTDEQWSKVSAWVESGHTALVAADETADKHFNLRAHGGRGKELRAGKMWHHKVGYVQPRLPGSRCFDGEPNELLVSDEKDCGYIKLRAAGKGWWLFAADDYLFTNAALALGDNAALLVDLCLSVSDGELELVDETTGISATSPMGSLLAGGFGAVLLQLGLVMLLLFAHRGIAFGARMDPPLKQRREFSEHVRALGLQYWKAHAWRYALALYGAWAVERLRTRVHMPAGDIGKLAAALAARSGEPQEQIRQLLAGVQTARQALDGAPWGGERAIMADLSRLLHKVGGTR